jgi:hypothetical protein
MSVAVLSKKSGRCTDAARHHTVAHVLVKWRTQRIAFEYLAISAAEARAAGFVDRELRAGRSRTSGTIERALRIGVEGLDALMRRRKDRVDTAADCSSERDRQPAAHAEFARGRPGHGW